MNARAWGVRHWRSRRSSATTARAGARPIRPCQPGPAQGDDRDRGCRTAALGGHVARCENVLRPHAISYNSCRNRHCPKCQGAAAREWLADREAELLPVPYFHVVFTLPAAIADIAYPEQAGGLQSAVQGFGRDAAHDRRRSQASGRAHRHHLGAPHMGLGDDAPPACPHDRTRRRHQPGRRTLDCRRPGFFLPVRVLSKLFRRLMLEKLEAAHAAGRLAFFGAQAGLADARAFATVLKPLRRTKWFVYSKAPSPAPRRCWRT